MGLRTRLVSGVSSQLRRPQGMRGRLMGRLLNRGNRTVVQAAVANAAGQPGQVVADLGFGGGVGLALLLTEVGPGGRVIGVDISTTMLDAARRRYRQELAEGRLTLHEGTMLRLPLPDGSVDALITVNTIYFVDDLRAVFAEMSRVLRTEARTVVGIGDPEAMAAMPFTRHGFLIRPVDAVARLMEDTGLGTVRHEQVGAGAGAAHLLIATRGRAQ